MYLVINAIEKEKRSITLVDESDVLYSEKLSVDQDLLTAIMDTLQKKSCAPPNLGGIIVVTGPGRFSIVRESIVITNTLCWAHKLPSVGFNASEFKDEEDLLKKGVEALKNKSGFSPLEPFYGREPNITQKKKTTK